MANGAGSTRIGGGGRDDGIAAPSGAASSIFAQGGVQPLAARQMRLIELS
jgi:hypothetical protein